MNPLMTDEEQMIQIMAEQKAKHQALINENFKEDGKAFSSLEAHNTVESLLVALKESQEIMQLLQPLLYELSLALYGENDEPVALTKLIEDGTLYIKKTHGVH